MEKKKANEFKIPTNKKKKKEKKRKNKYLPIP